MRDKFETLDKALESQTFCDWLDKGYYGLCFLNLGFEDSRGEYNTDARGDLYNELMAQNINCLTECGDQIMDSAFYGCSTIRKIIIPDNITKIKSFVFSGSTLSEIVIPKSVRFIGWETFALLDNKLTVYYRGSEDDFNKIDKSLDWVSDTDYEIIYNYKGN